MSFYSKKKKKTTNLIDSFLICTEGDWLSRFAGDQPSTDDGQGVTGPGRHADGLLTCESEHSALSCFVFGLLIPHIFK